MEKPPNQCIRSKSKEDDEDKKQKDFNSLWDLGGFALPSILLVKTFSLPVEKTVTEQGHCVINSFFIKIFLLTAQRINLLND